MRLLAIAASSAGLCCLLTALMIALARKRRWVFEPRSDRWARKPVAKFGGVPIVLTLLAAGAALHLPHRLQIVMALSGCIAALGLVDDIFQVPAWAKFSLQALIAGTAAWAGVVYPLFFSMPRILRSPCFGWWQSRMLSICSITWTAFLPALG